MIYKILNRKDKQWSTTHKHKRQTKDRATLKSTKRQTMIYKHNTKEKRSSNNEKYKKTNNDLKTNTKVN